MFFCFLSNTKTLISEMNENEDKDQNENKIEIEKLEILSESEIEKEIDGFKSSCTIHLNRSMNEIWEIISRCFFGYLIKKSYLRKNKYRIEYFIENIEEESNRKPEEMKEKEYAELRIVGTGSMTSCVLIYHIKRGELYVIKKTMLNYYEHQKLVNREVDNYKKLSHPLLPKYYGRVEGKGYIVIEYINGKTLEHINEIGLTIDDKINIIFELLMIFYYFHEEGMVYRDLKCNNVMIDKHKTAILIDFD